MKPLQKIAVSLLAASLLSTGAYAWGAKEQGAVLGVVGTLLVPSIINGFSNLNQTQAHQPQAEPRYAYDYEYQRPHRGYAKHKPHHKEVIIDKANTQKIVIQDEYGNKSVYFVEKGTDTVVIQR